MQIEIPDWLLKDIDEYLRLRVIPDSEFPGDKSICCVNLTGHIGERLTGLVCHARVSSKDAEGPDGYAYRYHDCIRFNHGQSVNGSNPTEAIPFYYGRPSPFAPSERGDAGLGFEVERFNGEDGVEVLIRDTDSPEWTSGLAWAKTSPETIVTMLADAYEALTRNSEKCNVPPRGWWCSRKKWHEGPCAARRAGLSSQEGK